jgi:preprotein translocase subunit SecD
MLKFPLWKILLILMPCLWGIYSFSPHFFYSQVEKYNDLKKSGLVETQKPLLESQLWYDWAPSDLVNLGLDLRGGAHVLVEVNLEDVYSERLQNFWPEIRKNLRAIRNEVGSFSQEVSALNDSLIITISKKGGIEKAISFLNKELSSKNSILEILRFENNKIKVSFDEQQKRKIDNQTMDQSLEIIRRRVDEAGTREPTIQKQGSRRILIQVPGLGSAEELLQLIGRTAKLTFHPVIKNSVSCEKKPGITSIIVENFDDIDNCLELEKKFVVSGSQLTNAQPSFDQNNRPAVSFQFNPVGGRKFGEYTKNNIGNPFAIVLDKQVISAPVIQSYIPGGAGIITGNFSVDESNRLAILLRAGALPASIQVLEQRTVGPELGADSIKSGKIAAIIAGILVLLFMIASYGLFGLFANVGLIFNIALIFSIMAYFSATLTLPGIAGIVLTIGMAVDANVLIFERIKEEIKTNKSLYRAIELGYEKALTSIIDANVTTFIAALILFSLGSGPIKGFSVTLGIGIMTSVFTAVYLTRLLISIYFGFKKPKILNL